MENGRTVVYVDHGAITSLHVAAKVGFGGIIAEGSLSILNISTLLLSLEEKTCRS